jgi:hypothetical protein
LPGSTPAPGLLKRGPFFFDPGQIFFDNAVNGLQGQALGGMHQHLSPVGDRQAHAAAAPADPQIEGQPLKNSSGIGHTDNFPLNKTSFLGTL